MEFYNDLFTIVAECEVSWERPTAQQTNSKRTANKCSPFFWKLLDLLLSSLPLVDILMTSHCNTMAGNMNPKCGCPQFLPIWFAYSLLLGFFQASLKISKSRKKKKKCCPRFSKNKRWDIFMYWKMPQRSFFFLENLGQHFFFKIYWPLVGVQIIQMAGS